MRILIFVILLTSLSFSIATAAEKPKISEAELQSELQRFASEYMDLLIQAVQSTSIKTEHKFDPILRRTLLRYVSALLEISTGPVVVENVLDMTTMMTLSTQSFKWYYIPEILGKDGVEIYDVLRDGETQIWSLVARLSTPEQRNNLRQIILDWRRAHPKQVRVEGVRFKEFARFAGEASDAQKEQAKGLFKSIESAVVTADRAVILAERSLFMAHRMPSLLRLQAVIGAGEITDEVSSQFVNTFGQSTQMLNELRRLDPFVGELSLLMTNASQFSVDAKKLVETVSPIERRGRPGEPRRIINALTEFSEKATVLLREANKKDLSELLNLSMQKADRFMLKTLIYLLLLGFGWALFWWGGYYLVKRKIISQNQA